MIVDSITMFCVTFLVTYTIPIECVWLISVGVTLSSDSFSSLVEREVVAGGVVGDVVGDVVGGVVECSRCSS